MQQSNRSCGSREVKGWYRVAYFSIKPTRKIYPSIDSIASRFAVESSGCRGPQFVNTGVVQGLYE